MDTSSPPSTTTLPPLPNTKLRLMVSYGGQIIPRADKKSLFYSSGETRIVAVDRRTTLTNLNTFMAHLSRTLFNNRPFILKYQIPSEDIDSLISVTSDEDLANMIEEHERAVSCSSGPARIRLFLFPTKPESVGTVLLDPKSDTWFNDALKSSMMIRGQSEDVGHGLLGFDGLGLLDSDGNGGDGVGNGGGGGGGNDGKNGLMDFGSESMVFENNSSFGSTGSSTSMSTLPTIGAFGEEEKKKVTVASSGSLDSDNSVASAVSHPKTGFYQDQAVHISSSDAKVSSNAVKPESVILEPSSLIQMKNAAQLSSYQLPPAPEEKLHQQVQYIHSGGHYVSQYPTGPLPFSSYYPVYQPQLHQQHVPYPANPPNPPYPVYLLAVRPNQSYNMSASQNLNVAATIAPSRPPLHPQTSLLSNQVAYKEVTQAPVLPELTSDSYWSAAPSIQKQLLDPLESCQPSLPVASSDQLVTTNSDAEIVVDDLAYAQIYKSQPPAPATTPPYEAMTNTTKVLLPETPTPLHGTSLQSKRPNV